MSVVRISQIWTSRDTKAPDTKVVFFTKTVNGFQALANFAKYFILDVLQGTEYSSDK